MAREGTRSATGNSRPRVFDVPDTAPVVTKKRATANTGAKRGPKTPTVKIAKPTGVTKKKAAPAKKTSVVDKVKGAAKKVEGAVTNNPQKKAAGTKKIKGTDSAGGKAKVPATRKK